MITDTCSTERSELVVTEAMSTEAARARVGGSLPTGQHDEVIYLAGGCFWGVEKFLRAATGVLDTEVGYMGGTAASPSYVEVCSGTTGHAETVKVTYDAAKTTAAEVLATFFEIHDPTQVNRQGNDIGTQYRSEIWTTSPEQYAEALEIKTQYDSKLRSLGYGPVATTVNPPPHEPFYHAEEYHQRYLEKNPGGYCNHGFNGVACPRGVL